MKANAYRTDIIPGCVLRTYDGSFWYCIGNWKPKGLHGVVPCVLGYVPEGERFPAVENQKRLRANGHDLLKIFGQPIGTIRTFLAQMGDFIEPLTLGRIVFLDTRNVVEVHNPKDFVRPFVEQIRPEGDLLIELCEHFGLDLDDIGIGGSSLMFRSPQRRPEIDFVIYDRKKSLRTVKAIFDGRANGLFADEWLGNFFLPFRYKSIWFDPQPCTAAEERDVLDGAELQVVGREERPVLEITENEESIFMPALYGTAGGRRLITFRPGQRAYFRTGQKVGFDSLSVVDVRWSDGREETLYGVLDEEFGTVLE